MLLVPSGHSSVPSLLIGSAATGYSKSAPLYTFSCGWLSSQQDRSSFITSFVSLLEWLSVCSSRLPPFNSEKTVLHPLEAFAAVLESCFSTPESWLHLHWPRTFLMNTSLWYKRFWGCWHLRLRLCWKSRPSFWSWKVRSRKRKCASVGCGIRRTMWSSRRWNRTYSKRSRRLHSQIYLNRGKITRV